MMQEQEGPLELDIWISALGRMSPSHPDMARILYVVERLQDRPYRSHALLQGEPGTGKEGLARLLHRLMNPDGGPCSTFEVLGRLPNEIADALDHELRKEKGGSLIIDELLALPADAQRRLQDYLSRQRFSDPEAVSVIALSDGNLDQAVAQGKLRHDLVYKLGRIVLNVPPLRERATDLAHSALWIANRILRSRDLAPFRGRIAELSGTDTALEFENRPYFFTGEALEALKQNASGWPGNFRELEAVLERAILLYSDGESLKAADVEHALLDSSTSLGTLRRTQS